jgi:uncharacterized protein (TIGR02217 family)
MVAQVITSNAYVAMQAPTGVQKQIGYAAVESRASVDSKGYMVAPSGPATIRTSHGYAAVSNDAAITHAPGYAAISNPASILGSTAYALFGNNPAHITASLGYAVLHTIYPPNEDLRLDADFVEQRFPECVSFGSQGGPGFKTSVFTFDSGFTAIEVEWDRLRARYTATFENATQEDIAEVEVFFYGMRGKALGFRYKDWSDYQITNQNMAVGDGVTTNFQMFKRYESGGHVFDRIIKKTVHLTADLKVDGVQLLEGDEYDILTSHGQIAFAAAPTNGSVITIDYIEYDVPVRFDTDRLDVAYDDFHQLSLNVELIEILI